MKSNIKITKKDCIGQLKGYPVRVAQRMVECQVEQGNKPDVTIFQKNSWTSKSAGGFYWEEAKEGHGFWNDIIENKRFDKFFEKYSTKNTFIPMPHTRFTAKLARQYGFEKNKLIATYHKYITKDLFLEFDATIKILILCGKSIYNNKDFGLTIPCYLDRINAIYFGLTGKNLEPIKK